jgi:hypothetical protein
MDPVLGEDLERDSGRDLDRLTVRILVEDLVLPAIQIPAHARNPGKYSIQSLTACTIGRLSPVGVTTVATTQRISKSGLASDSKPNPVN